MSRSSSHSSADKEQANDLHTSSAFAQSLLSARRPSWTPSLSFRDVPTDGVSTVALPLDSQPSSPEDAGNFRRSLQIDNKGLVGDAVGNVSKVASSIIFIDSPGSDAALFLDNVLSTFNSDLFTSLTCLPSPYRYVSRN